MDTHTSDTNYDWNDKLQDEGSWNRIKGTLREEWGELTDQGLEQARGNWEQFKGYVQQKTGAAADTVERKLRRIFD